MVLSKAFASGIDVAADMPLKGIAFLITGVTVFSLQDVIIKTLSDSYPAHEIVFVRGLVGRVTASQIAAASAASVLFRFTYGFT